jgi:hypothetical protein
MTEESQPPDLTPRQRALWENIVTRCTGIIRAGVNVGDEVNAGVIRAIDARLRWLEEREKEKVA